MLLLVIILSIKSPCEISFLLLQKSFANIIVKLKRESILFRVMDIGLSIPIRMSAEEKETYAKTAKEIGIDSIWVGDNPPINNAFLDIGRLFANIKDINFWTGITSPFYYSVEVLFSLSVWFARNYPGRFGLGLGIGNMDIIDEDLIRSHPYSNFKKEIDKLFQIIRIRKENQNEDDFPPLAIGGLGNKMMNLAFDSADYFLLNSVSVFDIERTLLQLESSILSGPKRTELIPYGMIQIAKNKLDISLTLWNIAKDIAKGCSTEILRSHGYSAGMIQKIRDLPWRRQYEVPKGEIVDIANDFAVIGTKEEIIERLEIFRKYGKEKTIKGIVLGWIHSENQWEELKEIVQFLK
jgi:alkanesulfonate monooxygenase SsuD/methylene tetrahydromethanopterin reductase-like flavin-dependent oxidoreductase (luciferase family)